MKKMICVLMSVCLLAFVGCAKQDPVETSAETSAETTGATEAESIRFRFDEVTLDNTQNPTYKIYNGTVKTSEVTFGSEDESVATFKNGIVVRVADGTTTVFAEYNGERLECVVTCVSE